MPITLDWKLIHRFENLPGTTKQAFKQALVRLQLGHGVRNESTKPDNEEAVYKCTLHYPCTRKYKLVRSGTTVLVYETGRSLAHHYANCYHTVSQAGAFLLTEDKL